MSDLEQQSLSDYKSKFNRQTNVVKSLESDLEKQSAMILHQSDQISSQQAVIMEQKEIMEKMLERYEALSNKMVEFEKNKREEVKTKQVLDQWVECANCGEKVQRKELLRFCSDHPSIDKAEQDVKNAYFASLKKDIATLFRKLDTDSKGYLFPLEVWRYYSSWELYPLCSTDRYQLREKMRRKEIQGLTGQELLECMKDAMVAHPFERCTQEDFWQRHNHPFKRPNLRMMHFIFKEHNFRESRMEADFCHIPLY